MQLLQRSMDFRPACRSAWGTPQPHTETDASLLHVATSAALQDQLEPKLLQAGIELRTTTDLCKPPRRDPGTATCVVVDLDLFSLESGALKAFLASEHGLPLILVGTCDDARLPVRALKAGAIDFFPKPIDVNALAAAIIAAVDQDRRMATKRLEQQELQSRVALLTPREREVLPLVVGGLLNKQAAAVLGISEITLQIHRGQVMRKMQATSLPDLVRMSMRLRIRHWRPTA